MLLWADDADPLTKRNPPDPADWRDFGKILINDLDTLALAAEIRVRETPGKAPEVSVPVGAAVHCAQLGEQVFFMVARSIAQARTGPSGRFPDFQARCASQQVREE